MRADGAGELVEALSEADLDARDEVGGLHRAVGDQVVDVEVRAGAGGPEVEVDVGREGGAAVGEPGREPVREPLAGAGDVDDAVPAPGDRVGVPGVLGVAVLQEDPAPGRASKARSETRRSSGVHQRASRAVSVRWRQTEPGSPASERWNRNERSSAHPGPSAASRSLARLSP